MSDVSGASAGANQHAVPPREASAARNGSPKSGVVRGGVESTGGAVKFAIDMIRQLPSAFRMYPSEVFRHAGLLIRSNSVVVLFMCFMTGALIGLVMHFLFISLGLDSYISATNSVAVMRGVLEVVFGWIIAAKVGCGIVAEIGAMKISDEVDAMEVMGIRSIAYLAGTRVLAGLIVIPGLWVASLSINFVAAYLTNVEFLRTVADGAFMYFLFLFQNVQDFMIALVWGTSVALLTITVGCYYGFTARGGPVGVGRNTAQSMLVNLVLISITAMMFEQLFYGNAPNAPIGN